MKLVEPVHGKLADFGGDKGRCGDVLDVKHIRSVGHALIGCVPRILVKTHFCISVEIGYVVHHSRHKFQAIEESVLVAQFVLVFCKVAYTLFALEKQLFPCVVVLYDVLKMPLVLLGYLIS